MQAAGASKQGCKQQAAGAVAIASKQPASQAAGKPPEYSAPPVVLWCRPPLRGRTSLLPLIRCAPVAAAAGHVAARRRAPAAAAARRRDADTAGRPVTAAPRHALHPLAICGGAVTRRSRRRRRRGERDGDWALGLGEEDSKEDKVALEVGSHTGIGLWWAKFASETDFGTVHFGFSGISGTGI